MKDVHYNGKHRFSVPDEAIKVAWNENGDLAWYTGDTKTRMGYFGQSYGIHVNQGGKWGYLMNESGYSAPEPPRKYNYYEWTTCYRLVRSSNGTYKLKPIKNNQVEKDLVKFFNDAGNRLKLWMFNVTSQDNLLDLMTTKQKDEASKTRQNEVINLLKQDPNYDYTFKKLKSKYCD